MSTKYIERRHDAAKVATGSHAGIGVEYSTNKIYVKPAPGVDRVELVDTTSVQTLTNKTFTSPVISNPIISAGSIILEGTTDDAFETTIAAEATGSDKTVTLPDATDTLVGKATTDTLTNKTLTSPVINTPTIDSPTITGNIVLEGTTPDDYETTIVSEATGSDKTITLPDATDTLVGKATTDTLTNKTLTAPVLTGPTGTGFTRTAIANFVEDATSVSHTATIPIPAGAVIQDIRVHQRVAWTATATLDVGDTADPNGFVAAAVLPAGESDPVVIGLFNSADDIERGAYYAAVDSDALVGPTSDNFGWYYVAGSNLIVTINVATPSATTGRTAVVVYYTVPVAFAPVLA